MQSTSRTRSLAAQHAAVMHFFPHFRLLEEDGGRVFYHGALQTSARKQYEIRLYLPPGSPDVKPRCVLWAPRKLPKRWWGTINEHGASHAWHTLANGEGGRVTICHYPLWDATCSYVGVLSRVLCWLEAYENHLKSNAKICDCFRS